MRHTGLSGRALTYTMACVFSSSTACMHLSNPLRWVALITLSAAPMMVVAGDCQTAEQSACTQNYRQETAQCDRYYLQRTEANALRSGPT